MAAPVVAPSREDPIVATASAVIGGPSGTRVRAVRHGWWRASRVLVVLAMVVLALGVVEKQHCRAQGWSSPDQFFHACYSDLPIVYQTSGLQAGDVPYVGRPAPGGADSTAAQFPDGAAARLDQPVLTGLALWGIAAAVPDGDTDDEIRWYFDLATVVTAVLLAALVALTAAGAGRRPWDAGLVAVSPLVALSALVSLDLLGVTLAAAGLLAWARRRPVAAGLLLGLAISARTYPVLLVAVLGLLALRAGQLRAWAATLLVSMATAVGMLLPWLALGSEGVLSSYRSWASAPAGYGSLWLLPQTLLAEPRPRWMDRLGIQSTTLSAGTVTTLAAVGVAVALVAAAVLALGSARRPRVAQLAFVVLAIVVVTGKSWPVQASLWLLPLAALARPRWRDHLVWVGAEMAYFLAVWLYIAASTNANRALPATWYSLFLLARVAGLLWLVWCVVADIRAPGRDVVRTEGADDPLGGKLDKADDALSVRLT